MNQFFIQNFKIVQFFYKKLKIELFFITNIILNKKFRDFGDFIYILQIIKKSINFCKKSKIN